MEQQWLTEKHYLVCPKGVMFKQMKVMSQREVSFSGHLAATTADTMIGNAFMCMGNLAVAAPPVSVLQKKAVAVMSVPGIGLPRMGIPPNLLLLASGMGTMKCNLSAPARKWIGASTKLEINGHAALVVGRSKLLCPSEAVMIDSVDTFWLAMTATSRRNLGNIAAFAYSLLAGRGLGNMNGGQQGAPAMFNPAALSGATSLISRQVKGTSVFSGSPEEVWNSEEQRSANQLQASGTELTISLFAAKGATMTCFPAGTLVYTNNGLLPIETITQEVLLWTMDEQTGERQLKPIKELHRRTALSMVVVELENGILFEVTPEHPFMTATGWMEAGALAPGHVLENITGQPVGIRHTGLIPASTTVYNFSMYDNENYFVTTEGILVHNASYC
ncbi:Hint domain-containing protein [Chitinophaga pinensis]|uniref:Hedgehog/intein hint domain protein n=1 Tax=Chitinophaga pinensis (strain ATCC 43595 / DSM 2588 / LMG 13176 / NBRC 15968 / NCIMB 11800 / UQM 2034) TaxID=485918 RepID=A0A979G7T6_CHIPD|nr:Hint domain-containing protein [Chitinophaga pinensis]ACU62296.1 Hedgehog/intein hint domain protein [Chitinophaga pinensis DSM 2588]